MFDLERTISHVQEHLLNLSRVCVDTLAAYTAGTRRKQ